MHSLEEIMKITTIRLLISGALLLPSIGQAATITCTFTEPFVTTIYNTKLNTLNATYDVDNRRETLKNISLQAVKPGVLELRNVKQEIIQRLKRSFRGSDGMSDNVYRYEVHWIPKQLYGGCERLKRRTKP